MAKALAHQDKQMTRIRHWYGYGSGPPDDLDLEWERLTTAAGFSETDLVMEAPEPGAAASTPASCPVLARPPFPPPSLDLKPAFPKEIGNELGGEVLTVWNFLYSFSDVLGLMPPSFDDLLHALVEGRTSGVLPRIHIALLRLLQADMEEAFAAGAAMVREWTGNDAETKTRNAYENILYPPSIRFLVPEILLTELWPFTEACWRRPGAGALMWTHGAPTWVPSLGARSSVK